MMGHDDYITWPERCGTCAYRKGTQANQSPLTQLKANATRSLCVRAKGQFWGNRAISADARGAL